MEPTIVVIAYNRPRALARLLKGVQKAIYPAGARLIVSIDSGGEHGEQVLRIADQFDWAHGEKRIILHESRLGLIGHVFFCGDLTEEVGPVILLEDDLYVSPVFYVYACQAIDYYRRDARIAGISLNAIWFNGYSHHPFVPYLDDSDAFFLQVPWFQGQAYTPGQWQRFKRWREDESIRPVDAGPIHEMFGKFPESDWFPLKTRYLVSTGRFYVFPRQSLSVNFGDRGTHFARPTRFFQVPLQPFRREYRLHSLDDAIAVYDSFQELLPDRLNRLTDQLASYDYVVDLNGMKSAENMPAEYVLTTKSCRSPLLTFGKEMWPLAANVVERVPGTGISLCRKDDLHLGRWSTAMMHKSNYEFFSRQRQPGWKRLLFYRVLDLLAKRDKH